jgi:hypothetical protein
MQDEHKPWWQDDPELEAIRRRTLDEILGDEREPIASDWPDPVVAELYAGRPCASSPRRATISHMPALDTRTRCGQHAITGSRGARSAGSSG